MADKKIILYKNQDYYKIRKECLENNELFQDEYFKCDVAGAMWLRPNKICNDPRFFVDDASRFDVVQGNSSDCWLVVAMANLTLNPKLFSYVVPKGQSFRENYAGIFHFRIWQCGDWVDVVVDDRLPTKMNQLIYTRSAEKNEFWSALLEKAYAKVYNGSYNELSAGWFCEGMVDFTGGIVERVNLNPVPSNLEKILLASCKYSSFMCVFMKDDPGTREQVTEEGLVKGHAYSITKAQTVTHPGKVFLLRLRNPWGKMEWKGAWSDSSLEWKSVPEDQKKTMGLVNETDGEFWISLSDFVRNFQFIDICHLSPRLFSSSDIEFDIGWESHAFKGEWIKGVNAGGYCRESFPKNPQYRITLIDVDDDEDDVCNVIIALMQRNKNRNTWHKIGFTAFFLEETNNLPKHLDETYINENFSKSSSSNFKRTREVVVRDKWQPGVYCILPSTVEPNKEGRFLLRVFSEKKSNMEETIGALPTDELPQLANVPQEPESSSKQVVQDVPPVPKPHRVSLVYKTDQEVREYFKKVAGREKEIGWQGLQSVLDYGLNKKGSSGTTGTPISPELSTNIVSSILSWVSGIFKGSSDSNDKLFTKDECRNLIAMLDDDQSGKLGLKEFQTLWSKVRQWEFAFLNCSNETEYVNVNRLQQALTSAGFRVSSSELGSFNRRYADDHGRFTFGDFVMCAVELQTSRR